MKYLQETTKWVDAPNIPNHIYVFEKDQCVGYIKAGTTNIEMFNAPMKRFSKSKRTFKEVKL